MYGPTAGDILTPMPPDADSEKSKFEKRLSVTKDIVGVIQSIFSIVALGAAAWWFYMQKPLTPVIKSHVDVAWIKHGDHFEVNALITFENTGHVPFKYGCVGVDHYTYKKIEVPAPDCKDKGTIFPGATKSDVNSDNSWAKDMVRIFQPVNLKDDDGNTK
jgi:hypothetical protein